MKMLFILIQCIILLSVSNKCVGRSSESADTSSPINPNQDHSNKGPRAEFVYLHLQSQLYNLLSQLYGHKSSLVSLRAHSHPEVNRFDARLNQYLYSFQRLQSELNDIWRQWTDKEDGLSALTLFQTKVNRFQTTLNDLQNELVHLQLFKQLPTNLLLSSDTHTIDQPVWLE